MKKFCTNWESKRLPYWWISLRCLYVATRVGKDRRRWHCTRWDRSQSWPKGRDKCV